MAQRITMQVRYRLIKFVHQFPHVGVRPDLRGSDAQERRGLRRVFVLDGLLRLGATRGNIPALDLADPGYEGALGRGPGRQTALAGEHRLGAESPQQHGQLPGHAQVHLRATEPAGRRTVRVAATPGRIDGQ